MVRLQLLGGSPAQWETVRLVVRDLNRYNGQMLFNIVPTSVNVVHINDDMFTSRQHKWLGWASIQPNAKTIALRATLHRAELYEVALHELGHLLGAGHSKSKKHIMSANAKLAPEDNILTIENRRFWCKELLTYVFSGSEPTACTVVQSK